jgi:hypothetical protein
MIRIAALAALFAATSVNAGQNGLWSLYVYEQAVNACGFQLTEEQEDDLDSAQERARIQMNLSRKEAAELYHWAREAVTVSRQEICAQQGLLTGSIQRKPD